MKFLTYIFGFLILSLVVSSGVVYAEEINDDDENALLASREALRNRFIDNCTKRKDTVKKSNRIVLSGCEINSKMSFVVKYDLINPPEVSFERGKDIPLARHYPKLKNALCSNSEEFADAEIESVTVVYRYDGKTIQSNFLDFNDCFLN